MRALLVVASLLTVLWNAPQGEEPKSEKNPTVTPEDSGLTVGILETLDGHHDQDAQEAQVPISSTTTAQGVVSTSAVDIGTALLDSFCSGTNWSSGCLPEPVAPASEPVTVAEAVLTPGMVAEAFRRIPLPASVLQVQPPDGETLVNFDTNFYTDAAAFDRTVVLLGQRIDLHIAPVGYTWVYGDGASASGTDPGAPYPDLRVTHAYLSKGPLSPRVDTTWGADYRVNGGGWQPVAGTVTITGQPEPLRVLEARPNLTGTG